MRTQLIDPMMLWSIGKWFTRFIFAFCWQFLYSRHPYNGRDTDHQFF